MYIRPKGNTRLYLCSYIYAAF